MRSTPSIYSYNPSLGTLRMYLQSAQALRQQYVSLFAKRAASNSGDSESIEHRMTRNVEQC